MVIDRQKIVKQIITSASDFDLFRMAVKSQEMYEAILKRQKEQVSATEMGLQLRGKTNGKLP